MNRRVLPGEPVVVPEWGRVTVACSAEVAAAMHADRHVRIAPIGVGTYEIQAQSKVGVLRYGELRLHVRPKVDVGRLLYLAVQSQIPEPWREVDALLTTADDPESALVHAFVRASELALRPAPMQGYVEREAAETRLRGRVDFARQIQLRGGLLLPAEIRYDEFETNIVENRLLKAAALLADSRSIEITLGLRRRLLHLRHQLDGVEPWRLGMPVPEIQFGRRNQHYRSAIALARLMLEGRSLEFLGGRAQNGTGFLIDMNRVFESYLTSRLALHLEAWGGKVKSQFTTHLDDSGLIELRPDVSWWRGSACRAVIDAKYKRVDDGSFPNADVYQMLAYCTSLALRRGWLVYADLGAQAAGLATVRRSGIEIMTRALPLDGSIAELDARVKRLADEIARGIEAPAVTT